MHLSILTISNSVPSIAISYNGLKAKGTFEHWGVEDFVVEPANITDIHSKVKHIEDNYKTIKDTMDKNREKVTELIERTLNKILQ